MRVEDIDVDKWRQFIEGLPDYSYFQTPEWAYAWEATYPEYEVCSKFFTFSDGTRILVPIIKVFAKYSCRHLISLPYGTYGGFLWNKEPDNSQIRQVIEHFLTLGVLSFELYPGPQVNSKLGFLRDYGFSDNPVFTHILCLKDGYETIWENVFKNRTEIRKALKEGVTIEAGDDLSDIQSYYELYKSSLGRWEMLNGGIIPYRFLENLFKLDNKNVKYYIARYKGKDIAGAIILYGKKNCFYWAGSMNKEYGYCQPNNLLLNEVIKDACSRGYYFFDMGASAGLPRVINFKESFGAKREEYSYYVYKNSFFEFYRRLKSLIIR